jgi:hypothetical protein
MPLIEAITIELGTAISKSILKCWLKDLPLAQDASLGLVDLLKARTSDVLAQRKGNRQFEEIGERVGKSLLPLFESEGASLTENSKTAVALAVADVFNNLSSKLLVERSLDPSELAKYILNT